MKRAFKRVLDAEPEAVVAPPGSAEPLLLDTDCVDRVLDMARSIQYISPLVVANETARIARGRDALRLAELELGRVGSGAAEAAKPPRKRGRLSGAAKDATAIESLLEQQHIVRTLKAQVSNASSRDGAAEPVPVKSLLVAAGLSGFLRNKGLCYLPLTDLGAVASTCPALRQPVRTFIRLRDHLGAARAAFEAGACLYLNRVTPLYKASWNELAESGLLPKRLSRSWDSPSSPGVATATSAASEGSSRSSWLAARAAPRARRSKRSTRHRSKTIEATRRRVRFATASTRPAV